MRHPQRAGCAIKRTRGGGGTRQDLRRGDELLLIGIETHTRGGQRELGREHGDGGGELAEGADLDAGGLELGVDAQIEIDAAVDMRQVVREQALLELLERVEFAARQRLAVGAHARQARDGRAELRQVDEGAHLRRQRVVQEGEAQRDAWSERGGDGEGGRVGDGL
jgi:hypothetical protein